MAPPPSTAASLPQRDLLGSGRITIALIGQSAVIAPSGEIVAMSTTLGDELATARCDLDATRSYKETVFNFARHRRPEHYRLIVERTGAEPPE